ncbi:MAG TPA: energy-coupling factor transporter transmembrane component T [Solirubrobacteraceae bacterium]|nr:energy-coupling factor transporter transmembrane component T [Solirubrobacteraceae bacterium]
MSAVAVPLGGSRLAAFNPAAKLAAAAAVLAGLLVTADLVTASIVLGAELVALPLAGIRARVLATRAWPLPLAAAGVAVANLLGSSAGAATIAGVSLRLLAIALPGILVFATTEPVDLADSLVQQLRVPARFAYGSLAAIGLLPLLAVDWATIRRARRARGIDAGHSPLAAMRLFASAVFALLVAAIRRATRLAAAMDSRGFDSRRPRTAARRQRFRAADAALVAVTVAVVATANGAALAAGTWHPLLG